MNVDIFEIGNIEMYLIAVFSKLKEKYFRSDIGEDICTQMQYLIIKLAIKKIWNGYGRVLTHKPI